MIKIQKYLATKSSYPPFKKFINELLIKYAHQLNPLESKKKYILHCIEKDFFSWLNINREKNVTTSNVQKKSKFFTIASQIIVAHMFSNECVIGQCLSFDFLSECQKPVFLSEIDDESELLFPNFDWMKVPSQNSEIVMQSESPQHSYIPLYLSLEDTKFQIMSDQLEINNIMNY
jgi:hypothetical protein